jgi:outer membrane protein assembly factor BamA
VKINHIDTLAPDVLAVRGSSNVASVAIAAAYDGSDSAFFPTKGYRVRGELEVAADCLGSDYEFIKGLVSGKIYRTVAETRDGRKHLLTFGGRVGVINAIGSDDMVPLFERFYAGGQNTVRGFSYRGLGPEQMGTEVGGEFMLVGNVEYSFPVYQTVVGGRQFEMIRGVVFCDVGQIAYETSDIGDTTWRVSVGAGVRLRIPALGGVPIALDFGFPINKDDDDDTQVFSFSMSTDF